MAAGAAGSWAAFLCRGKYREQTLSDRDRVARATCGRTDPDLGCSHRPWPPFVAILLK